MDIGNEPILLYNERCAICYRLARYASKITRGRIVVLGMFSERSRAYREEIIARVDSVEIYESMPWLIKKTKIYGGVSILPHIAVESIKALVKPGSHEFRDEKPNMCEPEVEGGGAVAKLRRWIALAKNTVVQLYSSVLTKRRVISLD